MTTPDLTITTPLADLPISASARILGFTDTCPDAVRRRLAGLGFVPGIEVVKMRRAPLGSPCVYRVMSYEICLRAREAAYIECTPTAVDDAVDGGRA
ncbi:ferrous iron transport protein A [Gordonia desulfuricans]|uniref:Ferrous iron transport protein A n=1 Tax=Gordonia desulfuricans TaxID=89051 RepID=A0A7K3LS73_9ACTN|nr:FeoA family protein [Gordonia desulfuricans]NDK91134.1 ferrous iron transport protein A [Gordonia desulfuricans]